MKNFWLNIAQGKTYMDVELYILPLAETRELVAVGQRERF